MDLKDHLKQVASLSLLFFLICGCTNEPIPYYIKGKPYEKVYKALSKKYELVYENSLTGVSEVIKEDNKYWVEFRLKDTDNEADYLKVMEIISNLLYKKETQLNKEERESYLTEWDYDNTKVQLLFPTNGDLIIWFIDKK